MSHIVASVNVIEEISITVKRIPPSGKVKRIIIGVIDETIVTNKHCVTTFLT